MRKLIFGGLSFALVGLLLAGTTSSVHAQGKSGSSGGSGLSSSGGSSGGSSSSGSFGSLGGTTTTNGNTFSGASGTGGSKSGGTSSNTTYGSGSTAVGPYYFNPLSYGYGGNTSATSSSAGNSSSSSSKGSSVGSSSGSSSSGSGFTNVQAASTVKFGQPQFNVSPVSTFTQPTSQLGTASIKTSNQQPTTNPLRVSYIARFSGPVQRVPTQQMTSGFQQVIASSPELSSGNNHVDLVMDGEVAVLRGVVQGTRERDLAQALASTTPGIHGVRNELAVRDNTPYDLGER